MKIVLEAQHAVDRSQPRGVGYYSISLIDALLKRKAHDYALTVFASGEDGNYERAKKYFGQYNFPIHDCTSIDYRTLERDNTLYDNKSYNDYSGTQSDIYHFTNFLTIPLNLKGKMLTTVHDLNWIPHEEGTSPHVLELLKINIKRLERIKPHIVAVSESAKREITEYTPLPPEKIHVVYQSYDEKNLYPDKSDRTVLDTMGIGDEYMFFVGTFERKKNIVRIVEAFNAIAQKHKHLQLVLAGQPTWDDSSSIYNAVRNSPFSERIILPGYIDTAVKRKLYSNAVCLVFPSICEGFGIPVLEAMVCGCPVITADNTSLPEVGGDAAIYVNALDSNALSHEMDRMISSRSLRKDLTERGLLQAKKFSWDKTARQIEDIYKLMSEE